MTAGAESERLRSIVREVSVALRRRGETVAVAESCTGGWLGRALTSQAGASEVFRGGVIAYADAAKVELAGVAPGLIATHGAVSEPVARALAEGLGSRVGADWTVAITGIAGPGGGSDEKPVGTVWIAVAGRDGCSAIRRRLDGDRRRIRGRAVEESLRDLLDRLEAAP